MMYSIFFHKSSTFFLQIQSHKTDSFSHHGFVIIEFMDLLAEIKIKKVKIIIVQDQLLLKVGFVIL